MPTGLFTLTQVNQAIRQGAWTGYIAPTWVEYLVVAGGGGGGYNLAAGGGAGGLLQGVVSVPSNTSLTVTVGSGGAGGISTVGTNGQNSVFGSIAATGGGGGSGPYNGAVIGSSGGSGGGATYLSTFGQGTSSQGNAGGAGVGSNYGGGGGGGAGTIGLSAITNVAGNGGAGIASAITGTVTTYAGGGGGGIHDGAGGIAGVGGVGGGGSGGRTSGTTRTAGGGNTGGGGGGGEYLTTGGSGGSGIVIIRYPGTVQFFTGGTLSYANGYVIHTFYTSGTLAPTTPTPYVAADYQISRSLRFNSADSAYLNRTPASAGNRKTWTWSGWVKRSALGEAPLFGAGSASNPRGAISFNTDNTLYFYDHTDGTFAPTAAVFRDASAWYHIVVAYDSTQSTNTNRVKIYVNNVQQTIGGTPAWPAQNYDSVFNNNITHQVGSYIVQAFYNGYMTEVNFIDGQALTPSSFGYYDFNTGVWTPMKYVGTYGTNGFYLNFSDNSNTTATTLGKDYSGNGNNWTPNNFSVSAGAGNDSLVDVPTAWGTDTGVGGTVRGNYATLNPLDNGGLTLANGNLQFDRAAASWLATKATFGMSSGKWYWEITVASIGTTSFAIFGIGTSASSNATYVGAGTTSWGYSGGSKYTNGSSTSYGTAFGVNDVVGVAFDADAGSLTFYNNGVSQGVAFSGLLADTYFPMVSLFGTYSSNINFGQRPFAYTAPSGFKALCTQNLPTPTIGATSTTLASKFFAPVIYTPTSYPAVTTGVGFQPDFTWWKNRVRGEGHILFDVLRGSNLFLRSNTTAADDTQTNGWVANSDGWTSSSGSYTLNEAYVAWNWKANGAGVTNTAGSITSTVSANTTSGFSVVTFTGTGSAATVGHGLGVAPRMIISKVRNQVDNWYVYHVSMGTNKYMQLNTTASAITDAGIWQNTAPTSSVFSIGGAAFPNTWTEVAYCFAEVPGFSKFGSYTGNNSTDGPFVYCGFRPAWLLVKRTANVAGWFMVDSKRNTYNLVNNYLYANTSDAEQQYPIVDFLSNGFKVRMADTSMNAPGETYVFAAFAEAPQKFALAR